MNQSEKQAPVWGPLDWLARNSSNGLMILACVAITLMMVHVTLDVAGKHLFSEPVPATFETVEDYYMVMLVFLPFAYIARGEEHISVELFTRKMAPRPRFALDAAVGVLTLVWVGLLAWYSTEEAITTTLDGDLREIAEGYILVWPSRWFVPLGSGAMAIAVVIRIIEDAKAALRTE